MEKKNLWIILDLVFLIVFNMVFFVVGGSEHPVSVWISYIFIHISYIMILITPFLIKKSNSDMILGSALYSISSVYFFIEFFVGLVFIFIRDESYKASLLTQIVIAGLYVVILLSNIISNEHTAANIEKHESELLFIKENSSRVKLLIGKLPDKSANKELEKLYDFLYSSPVETDSLVKQIEQDVSNNIRQLECLVVDTNISNVIEICRETISLMERRNEILKTKK